MYMVVAMAAPALAGDGEGRLAVRVSGLEHMTGELAVAVFDSEDGYKKQTGALSRAFVPVVADPVTWETSLPIGPRYVVIVYHDVNGNRELDRRLLGIPKEPVGVSNDARGRFGPPDFDAASFVLAGAETLIDITLE
jgi:uncharacterized protein (DUF2141 family)